MIGISNCPKRSPITGRCVLGCTERALPRFCKMETVNETRDRVDDGDAGAVGGGLWTALVDLPAPLDIGELWERVKSKADAAFRVWFEQNLNSLQAEGVTPNRVTVEFTAKDYAYYICVDGHRRAGFRFLFCKERGADACRDHIQVR